MTFACRIAADSIAQCNARLTTYIVTYPRAIHSEIMTHKMLSKSSASSRAIPSARLIGRVEESPWIPDYIGANQKGMQPGEELSGDVRIQAVDEWIHASKDAVAHARALEKLGIHKGVVNRVVETWMWITVIISGTEWSNFFGLRCHEAAEPHFQHIARMMRAAMLESVPTQLGENDWHMPLIFDEDWPAAYDLLGLGGAAPSPGARIEAQKLLLKVSVGRCARVSYLTHDGRRDLREDIRLHDDLMTKRPLHAAPAEHVARGMSWPVWTKGLLDFRSPAALREEVVRCRKERIDLRRAPTEHEMVMETALGELTSGNYLGFTQYRKTLPDEHIGGLMP